MFLFLWVVGGLPIYFEVQDSAMLPEPKPREAALRAALAPVIYALSVGEAIEGGFVNWGIWAAAIFLLIGIAAMGVFFCSRSAKRVGIAGIVLVVSALLGLGCFLVVW